MGVGNIKQEKISLKRKEQMANSLKKPMAKNSFQKITIQDIANDCGINRYTFYYHFKDIYDLLAWTFQRDALALIEKSENCLTWQEAFRLFLLNIKENRQAYRCAINSLGQETLRATCYQEANHLMRLFLSDSLETHKISEEYLSFLSDFYAAALGGMIMEWIRRDFDFSEETILSYLRPIFEEQFKEVFQKAEQFGL